MSTSSKSPGRPEDRDTDDLHGEVQGPSSGTWEPVDVYGASRHPARRVVLLAALAGAAASSCTATGPEHSASSASTSPTTTDVAGKSTAPPSPPPAATSTAGGSGSAVHVLSVSGPDIVTGPTVVSAVALTFHGAGDPNLTAQALSITAASGAKVTVFAVGQWLAANPSLGRDIVAAGHDLGNHTWSHQPMTSLTLVQATDEIRRGADAVTKAVGSAGLLFRPSGTPHSTPSITAAARTVGYRRCVSYDVDPVDYADPGAELVRTRTLSAVRSGSIVSLHLGHQGTITALPGILAGLRARGLAAVTMTQLLATTS